MKRSNVLIIGSGIAALQLSKKLRSDLNVIILTKSDMKTSNSYLAQGGVAAAVGENDDPYKHYLDTLEAGRYHNQENIVFEMAKEAPSLINELLTKGCPFDKDQSGKLLLGMEGAHSDNRIVHGGGDATGKTIMEFFHQHIGPNVSVIENITVYELIIQNNRCIGAKGKLLDGSTKVFLADYVVIATGGCGQIFSFTSNAETVTGDGIALAYIAGAEITDMEFIQFHPTLLNVNGQGKGLVSEAVRGEGARLVTKEKKRIMEGVHPLADLAPRHIVSQTIYNYILRGIEVFLDITSIPNFSNKFPTITELCEKNGIDLKDGFIPVVPGSHFLMGGIKTDVIGRTSILGLYAIGEAACTGIHGANRLASNSLLEGLFFGKKIADWINQHPVYLGNKSMEDKVVIDSPEFLKLPETSELKKRMMDYTGIVRSGSTLSLQKEWLESYQVNKWIHANFESMKQADITKAFMLITSWLITDSALKRTESRGGHFREDYPAENDEKWRQKQIIQIKQRDEVEDYEQIKTSLAT